MAEAMAMAMAEAMAERRELRGRVLGVVEVEVERCGRPVGGEDGGSRSSRGGSSDSGRQATAADVLGGQRARRAHGGKRLQQLYEW